MDNKSKIYESLKANGLTSDQETTISEELYDDREHRLPEGENTDLHEEGARLQPATIYQYHDLIHVQALAPMRSTYTATVRSIDELLERDRLT